MSRKQRTATEDTSFNTEEFDSQPQAAAAIQSVADSTRMPESNLDRELADQAEQRQGKYTGTEKRRNTNERPIPWANIPLT